jgi:putative two-component system response regulator
MENLRELILSQAILFAAHLHRHTSTLDVQGACDIEMAQHGYRTERIVSILVKRISLHPCDAFPLSDFEIEHLPFAARLHDIGKIGVPVAILEKPSRLDSMEMSIMSLHPILGQAIIRATRPYAEAHRKVLDLIETAVLHHHERWDGTGYPGNCVGPAIPLPARIVALADAYDAITSPRVYKPGRPHSEAMQLLVRESGKQFDPALLAPFCDVADEIGAKQI